MHMRRRGGPRTVKSGQLLLGPTGAGCLQPFPCIDCGLRLVEGPLALLRFQVNQEPLDHTVIHVMGPDAITPAEDNKGPDLRDVMPQASAAGPGTLLPAPRQNGKESGGEKGVRRVRT